MAGLAMLAQLFAVIRGHHHQRAVELAAPLEGGEQLAGDLVGVGDVEVVEGVEFLAPGRR